MVSKFLNMRMSLLPPNMSDCLAGHRFEYKSIVILTLQKLNSLRLKYRIVKENYGIEMAFFLFCVAWFSARMVFACFYFFKFYSCHCQVPFSSVIFHQICLGPGSLFWFKASALFDLVNLPSFVLSLFRLLSSAESFSPSNALGILMNVGELLQSPSFLLSFHLHYWSLCYFPLCSGEARLYVYTW